MSTQTAVPVDPADSGRAAPPPGISAAGPGWRVLGGILAVLLIAAGTLSAAGWLARRTATQDTTYQDAIDRIVIDAGSGDVDVSTGTGDTVRVHRHLVWAFRKPILRERRAGDTLRLAFDCPAVSFGPGCGVDYRLTVPADIALDVNTTSGDARVSGVAGPVTVGSGAGSVSVTGTRHALSLRTSSGDITAERVSSTRATVRTSTGDVNLAFAVAPESVDIGTGSGDVTVVVPEGRPYLVQTRSGSGDRTVRVAQSAAASSTLTVGTGTGDIMIMYG